MSEHAPNDGTAGTWLSVADAARALEVSPRTMRRMCERGQIAATLEPNETGTGGRAWRISPDAITARQKVDRAASRTHSQSDSERPEVVTARPAGHTERTQNTNERPKVGRADSRTKADGQANGQPRGQADGQILTALMAEKDARISDLRTELDAAKEREKAARLQIEAANRATAEAHAALREALKMSSRALPVGNESDAANDAPAEPMQVLADALQSPTIAPERAQNPATNQQPPMTKPRKISRGFRGFLLKVLRDD